MKIIIAKVNYFQVFVVHFTTLFVLWVIPLIVGKYADTTFSYIKKDDIIEELVGIVGTTSNTEELCPALPTELQFNRRLESSDNVVGISEDEEREFAKRHGISSGGLWKPKTCESRYQVVVIVPYRDREHQLKKFLSYMHSFLQRQQLFYRIIVIEQSEEGAFNRGKLFNAGFVEALKLDAPHHCFIFHDVDLLPQNDFNFYACTHQPRHMYSSLDIFRYHLPYRRLFGGAVAMQSIHFRNVNGFSNIFAGWGGEDDDLYSRLEEKGLNIVRFDPEVASYTMMSHAPAIPSPERWQHMSKSLMNLREDGLANLKYSVIKQEFRPLYTYFLVAL